MLHVEFQMQLIVQVRAVGKAPAYAAQVPAVAASLNSGDVFIAVTADKVYTWAGDSSTEEEHATAADVAEKLLAGATTREPVSVTEGEETEDFWAAIGGQGAPLFASCSFSRCKREASCWHRSWAELCEAKNASRGSMSQVLLRQCSQWGLAIGFSRLKHRWIQMSVRCRRVSKDPSSGRAAPPTPLLHQ